MSITIKIKKYSHNWRDYDPKNPQRSHSSVQLPLLAWPHTSPHRGSLKDLRLHVPSLPHFLTLSLLPSQLPGLAAYCSGVILRDDAVHKPLSDSMLSLTWVFCTTFLSFFSHPPTQLRAQSPSLQMFTCQWTSMSFILVALTLLAWSTPLLDEFNCASPHLLRGSEWGWMESSHSTTDLCSIRLAPILTRVFIAQCWWKPLHFLVNSLHVTSKDFSSLIYTLQWKNTLAPLSDLYSQQRTPFHSSGAVHG